MIFKSTDRYAGMKDYETRQGEINIIYRTAKECEFEAIIDGDVFRIIIGKHRTGRFLCVPNWNIGTEMVETSDTFWNSERIEKYFPEIEPNKIASIVAAIKAVGEKIDI